MSWSAAALISEKNAVLVLTKMGVVLLNKNENEVPPIVNNMITNGTTKTSTRLGETGSSRKGADRHPAQHTPSRRRTTTRR